MPLYHFNVHDGVSLPDPEGSELPDLHAARTAAVQLAGSMLRDNAAQFWTGAEWRLEVTDADGLVLFVLTFVATDAPGTSRA